MMVHALHVIIIAILIFFLLHAWREFLLHLKQACAFIHLSMYLMSYPYPRRQNLPFRSPLTFPLLTVSASPASAGHFQCQDCLSENLQIPLASFFSRQK